MEETLKCEREMIDGVYVYVHTSADGKIRIVQHNCDQKPDADGVSIFRPICVAEMLWSKSDEVYTYHYYCGACRKRMGSMAQVQEFCGRCGKQVGHYRFSMGFEKYFKPEREPRDLSQPYVQPSKEEIDARWESIQMPDAWIGSGTDSAQAKLAVERAGAPAQKNSSSNSPISPSEDDL